MHTLVAIALVVTSVGCARTKRRPPAPTAGDAAGAPIDAGAPDVDAGLDAGPAMLTPAPGARGVQINDLEYGGFAQPGLPAIKDDGSEVVATTVADDGGRGYLDLAVVVVDGATGRVRTRLRLVDPDETSAAIAADDTAGDQAATAALAAQVQTRVAAANALVATGTWRTLTGARRADDAGEPADPEALTVGDLTVTYALAGQTLTIARAGATVATHPLRALAPDLARPAPGAPDDACPGDLVYLAGAYPDPPSKRLVLELGRAAQGHNCGAAGQVYAVVPLP
ncbi:MAG: hypothetical protein IPL61_25120 [Myxococcales bacterium]|nr:hypothetical protein [Myxococcales bacterium]